MRFGDCEPACAHDEAATLFSLAAFECVPMMHVRLEAALIRFLDGLKAKPGRIRDAVFLREGLRYGFCDGLSRRFTISTPQDPSLLHVPLGSGAE